jgi:hypothetical protein
MSEQDGWMVPWFSFVIPSFECLDVLPKELAIPFVSPSSDLSDRPRRVLGDYKRPIVLQCAEPPPVNGQYYLQLDVWISEGRSPSGLQSKALNLVTEESGQRNGPAPNTWAGQNEFALLSNQLWIRTMTSIRLGEAERPCLLAIRKDRQALLL